MNWTTPTLHPRAHPRPITPKAADDLPFPWPVLTSTIDGARVTRWRVTSPLNRAGNPVRLRGCPATVEPDPCPFVRVGRTRGRTTPVAPGGRARPAGGGVEVRGASAGHRVD